MSRTSRKTRRDRTARLELETMETRNLLSGGTALAGDFANSTGEVVSQFLPLKLQDGRTTDLTAWESAPSTSNPNGTVVRDDPIAIWSRVPSKTSGFQPGGQLLYHFGFPDAPTGDRLRIQYTAAIAGNSGVATSLSGTPCQAVGSVTTAGGTISLPRPADVGQYTLHVTLVIHDNGSYVTTQTRDHTLYDLFSKPTTPALFSFSDSPPIQDGAAPIGDVQKAVGWASGASTDQDVMTALTQTMYSNPLGWSYAHGELSAQELLDTPGGDGVCYNLADALAILASLDGLNVGLANYQHVGYDLIPHAPLNGVGAGNSNADGNAINATTGVADAWILGVAVHAPRVTSVQNCV
jgi:hypothetical protein